MSTDFQKLQKIIDLVQPKNAKIQDEILEIGRGRCIDCNVRLGFYQNEFSLGCPVCKKNIDAPKEEVSQSTQAGLNNNFDNKKYNPGNTNVAYARRKKFLDRLLEKNFQCDEFKIPVHVLEDAVDTYIDSKLSTRGMTLEGILSACIMESSNASGCPKTKTQMSVWMDVDESKITAGMLLLKTNGMDVSFEITHKYFLEGFLIDYKIDTKYSDFLCALYDRIHAKSIPEIMGKYMETICIGCVYLLSVQLGKPVSHSTITHFKPTITRSTYVNVYNSIINNEKKLRKVFIRHGIPVPHGWRK